MTIGNSLTKRQQPRPNSGTRLLNRRIGKNFYANWLSDVARRGPTQSVMALVTRASDRKKATAAPQLGYAAVEQADRQEFLCKLAVRRSAQRSHPIRHGFGHARFRSEKGNSRAPTRVRGC